MATIDLSKRNIGLNFLTTLKAEFLLWAPLAKSVALIVNDEKTLYPELTEYGYWELKTNEIKPGDTYQVKVNNRKLLPDPASLSQPEGVHGSSRAFDLNSYTWSDGNWKGIEDKEIVFYELHTGTFSKEGTFEGIAGKINHLKDLGINAIELMPVTQFPGSRNWGYDGVYPFAVQNSYGGAFELQKLVDVCHKNGLAVILDVVYNHLGPEGNYLGEFAPYFTDKYKTPWGKAINYDDAWCDGVRRFYIENMLMWFRDFHIDGLRLDAVHAIKDFSAKHILHEFRDYVNDLMKITGKKYLLIGEVDLNDTKFIDKTEKGGYGLDMQWCDEFHHSLHALLTKEQNGYYSDFGETWQLVKSFNNAYVYDGIFSMHRKKTFGSKTTGFSGNKFVVFIQNHDHIGNRMLGERLGSILDFEAMKLAAGIMFISPYVPLIFMGEEYGEKNPFLYFVSHTDEELVELVRKGRKEEFKDFVSIQNVPDPQSMDTFNRSKLNLKEADIEKNPLFLYYKELIRLKKNHTVWKSHDRSNFISREIEKKVVLVNKKINANFLVAIMNFNTNEAEFNVDDISDKKLLVLIDSSDKKWNGKKEDDSEKIIKDKIKVSPGSIIVLSDIP